MCFTALPFPHIERQPVGWGGGGMVYLSQASHSLLQSQEMLMYPKSNIHMESPTYRDFKKSSWIIAFPVQLGLMEISKDQPNENKHRLFIQPLLHTERATSSHCCWCFGGDSKAGRGVGSVMGEKGKASRVL